MKPPITYYGGKQKLAPKILPLIPEHTLYCEPFFGGGAVFFAKPPSEIEVINDTNGELINFFKVIKNSFAELECEIQSTLHSRKLHAQAEVIYKNSELFTDIKRAWALWVLASQSYASKLNGSWGYDRKENKSGKQLSEKRIAFTKHYSERLEKAQIECSDALRVIESRDSKESFFYCDPPYFNSHQGHYKGYSEKDFEKLLSLLANIKGRFLLSSYPSDILEKYSKKNGWFTYSLDVALSLASAKNATRTRKTEMLTANYVVLNSSLFQQ